MQELSLPDLSILAAPLYVIFILLELLAIKFFKARGDYETYDANCSLLMGLGSIVTGALYGLVVTALFYWVYQHRITTISVGFWSIALCFILDDFRYYWSHRFRHIIRWSWASHVVHHSSQHFNLSTALRQSWTGFFSGMFVLSLPLIWLGFHPAVVLFVNSLNLVYQFFIHTETVDKCPKWVEMIMNTPSHHRVHHGRNVRYLDANYAGVFIIWDKLFGTFVPETDEKVEYGLVHNIGTFNPIRVATHEYISILEDLRISGIKFKDRLMYLFAPPGWSHDHSRLPSKQRKKKLMQERPELIGQIGFPEKFLN